MAGLAAIANGQIFKFSNGQMRTGMRGAVIGGLI
jgi:hypothetical protein